MRTFTTNPIALTLEQMKRIDLGERLTVMVENFSYGADELFYTNAVTGGVTVFIEDGVEDGDETVDSYVIPTWGVESVQDVLTRYFLPPGQMHRRRWQPQLALDAGVRRRQPADLARTLPLRHRLVERLSDAGRCGRHPLQELPAQAGSGMLFRFNRDSDRDGYNDRVEIRYYCALPATIPTTRTAPTRTCGRRSIPSRKCWPATWPSAAGTWSR